MTTNNEEREIITLEYDDGEEIEFYEEGVVTVNDQDYIVLVQVDQEDMLEVYRLEATENDGEEEIVSIEDEAEYDAVFDELRQCGYDIRVDE